jgi:CRISPR-associated Csx2 family protein
VRFIQEATLEYLQSVEEWTSNDAAYILLTKGAEKVNWYDDGHKDRNTGEIIKCEGLQSRLHNLALPIDISIINNLPDGNDESEIWEIFNRVFSELRNDDELYFDFTHGFRYLPMLVMVLINYSKFLKNTNVRSITYGNYESRNRETNEAPIIDMLPLSALQDWTFAAGQFLDSGNVTKLLQLCEEELKPILKDAKGSNQDATNLKKFVRSLNDVIDERQTCRGMSIIKSESFLKMKHSSDQLETTIIPPLNPIFDRIKHSMVFFDEDENVKNGFSAAVWCFQNGMLQQSATILQEFVITYICLRHGIRIDDEERRDWVTSAFAIKFNNLPKSDWKLNHDHDVRAKQSECIENILHDDLFTHNEFINAFNSLSEVRNDYNHSGMRSKRLPLKPAKIKENIKKCIDLFAVLLYNVKLEL